MPHRRLLVDACVLINLLATDRLAEIAAANGFAVAIVRQVAEETFFLRQDDPGVGRTPVDLGAHCAAGTIEVIDLNDDELALFVAFAARVDDGEAATLAAAVNRGLPLATDDRGALNLMAREHPEVEPHRTTVLLRRWAATGASPTVIVSALGAVERRARFIPGVSDPDEAWWRVHCVLDHSSAS